MSMSIMYCVLNIFIKNKRTVCIHSPFCRYYVVITLLLRRYYVIIT